MRFWEVYRIVRKRRWLIAWLVIVTCSSVLIVTANRKPTYRAIAQILPSDAALYRPILPDTTQDPAGEPRASRAEARGQLPNLMSLITSRTVAERTVRALGLSIPADDFRKRVAVWTAPNPGARSARESATDVVQISVQDTDKDRAVRSANMVAAVFSSYYQEISHQEAIDNAQFLQTQLVAARQKLDDSSGALVKFKSENNITALPEETSATVSRLGSAKAERDTALAAYAEANAKLSRVNEQLRRVSPERVTVEGTTNTPLVQQLETQVASLSTQLNEANAKYTESHPIVMNLKQSLLEAQDQLRRERNKVNLKRNVASNPVYEGLLQQKVTLQAEADGLAARVAQLSGAVGRTSAGLKPGLDIRLARLQQDFADAQSSYSAIKTRLNQARISEQETTDTGAIRLVDSADRAEEEVKMSRTTYLLLALMLSLVVGVSLSIALEALDNRIKTSVDLEQLMALPVTGLVPKLPGGAARALPRITYVDPLSPLSEAYKFIRTDLLLTAADEPTNVVMVATAKPGQGGTTTAANLAISLALDGKRVVLVDADMRRPQLHGVFKTSNEMGLSDVLSGQKDPDEALVATEIPNLFLIPAGPTPINPSELLGSHRMVQLIEALRQSADFVLFDTPSAVAFTDSIVLSRFMDGVLLVVRANQAPRGAELQVRNLLNKAGARIIGLVLNDVQPESVDSYYYHSHYYPNVKPAGLALTGYAGGSLPPPEEE